jgi:hypothetical protein
MSVVVAPEPQRRLSAPLPGTFNDAIVVAREYPAMRMAVEVLVRGSHHQRARAHTTRRLDPVHGVDHLVRDCLTR